METQGSMEAMAVLLILPLISCVCLSMYFIIRYTHFSGRKIFIRVFFITFFVAILIPYSGTLYSFDVFEGAMTKLDAILVMFSHVPSLVIILLIMIRICQSGTFFNQAELVETVDKKKPDIKSFVINLGLGGTVYAIAYLIFAIFFQWQFDEFRTFYSDTPWGQGFWSGNNSLLFIFASFTIIRGMFYGFIALILLSMVNKSKIVYITSICLIFISPALNHLVPNTFMPSIVRFLHLISMTGSMLLFGIIMGNILWRRN
jgi:hypothetical protein